MGQRILENLMGAEKIDRHKVSEKVIIVAHDLSPADSAHLDLEKVLGFVTDVGGKTSHTAIMARALQIPAVVGLETVTRQIQSGDSIIVDGISGEVIIHPSQNVFNDYRAKKEKYDYSEKELLKFKPLLAETRDGYRIRLLANIEITEELPSVLHHGAEGIGLYRTEFLYLNRPELPSEEEHFQTYRKVIEKISPNPTTIRTFDLGGDKFISRINVAQEMNPALGLRAIRLGLREVDLFKTQIRRFCVPALWERSAFFFPWFPECRRFIRSKTLLRKLKRN